MKKSIAIIGGGPSSLMLASVIDTAKYDVTIYEQNKTLGRKFLVAGKGGFNLTHSEEVSSFINHYIPVSFFSGIIQRFDNGDLQQWLKNAGIATYVGTSNRVFPLKEIKPIHVLNAFLNIINQKKINIKTQHKWKGWTINNELLFRNNHMDVFVKSDIVVFALGGASWKVTGSDGSWLSYFEDKGVNTLPFQPSNCSFEIKWPEAFLKIAEGESLKNISI
ncbi:MAG TPA: NAD(P)/FAD-dependent oxidoreductase, partial [Chitinophagales bacterium]|nr:NAD(P)/FAD-dependent oxidoreductase [Chitinophagales bacterium]